MYRRIGALAELLQLLEAAWVSSRVHPLLYGLAVAQVPDTYRGLGAKGNGKGASDGRLKLAGRWAIGILPELGARSRDLAGDAQERRRRGRAVWGGGRGRRGE